MDDISEKVSSMLKDPESMEKLKAMASSLFSGDCDKAQSGGNNTGGAGALGALGSLGNNSGIGDLGLDPAALLKVASLLKNNANDDRANLLYALKPHLTSERQSRVDKAVKILKLVSLVPIFKEQGILDF